MTTRKNSTPAAPLSGASMAPEVAALFRVPAFCKRTSKAEERNGSEASRQGGGRDRGQFGRVVGPVNNAGTNDVAGLEAGPEAFRASLGQNMLHYYPPAHLLMEDIEASKGVIVYISSWTALTGQESTSAYVATKVAQPDLTREWAAALGPDGVWVNAVIPAEVGTPMYHSWLQGFDDPSQLKALINARIPLSNRMTTAEEIAANVIFLLHDRAGHTTGQWLFVEGGLSTVTAPWGVRTGHLRRVLLQVPPTAVVFP